MENHESPQPLKDKAKATKVYEIKIEGVNEAIAAVNDLNAKATAAFKAAEKSVDALKFEAVTLNIPERVKVAHTLTAKKSRPNAATVFTPGNGENGTRIAPTIRTKKSR